MKNNEIRPCRVSEWEEKCPDYACFDRVIFMKDSHYVQEVFGYIRIETREHIRKQIKVRWNWLGMCFKYPQNTRLPQFDIKLK